MNWCSMCRRGLMRNFTGLLRFPGIFRKKALLPFAIVHCGKIDCGLPKIGEAAKQHHHQCLHRYHLSRKRNGEA